MKNPGIAFFGSPQLAQGCLDALLDHFTVRLVVTRPDRERGRGRRVSMTPVKARALELHLPLYQDGDLGEPLIEVLQSRGVELIVVVAFGRILPDSIIFLPPLRSLNLHASLLPKFRGASPIEAALLAGEGETGVTLQLMVPEMDRGDILASERIPIEEHWTAGHLHEEIAGRAPGFLVRSLEEYLSGCLTPVPQDERLASYCSVIRKEDGRLDWSEPAERIRNRIRAYSLWPVAHTRLDHKLLRIFNAGIPDLQMDRHALPGEILEADRKQGIIVNTGEGVLSLTDLQIENRRRMDFRTFMNGYRDLRGKLLE
jgi:methionyl-tRNA formyltransferase